MVRKLSDKDVKRLKPTFDKLTTYKDKIEFWEENILPYSDFETIVIEPENITEEERRNLQHNPKHVLSIVPKEANEIKEYSAWKEKMIAGKLSELNLIKIQMESLQDANTKKSLSKFYENGVWINPIGIDKLEYEKLKQSTLSVKGEEVQTKPVKDKLTHKQQILLLNQLGFFELDRFKQLNETQKGDLVSHLLNRTEKDSEDYVRYVGGAKKIPTQFTIKTEANKKKINELLEKVGLKEYRVK